jgi:general L-amino acid transport system permease protein
MNVQAPPLAIKRSRTTRSIVVQLTTVAVLTTSLAWLFTNVQANLASRSIASGFGFLNDAAGFAIGETSFEYNPSHSFARAILVGLVNTLKVSALAIAAATFLGTLVGFARLSRNVLLRGSARAYIEIVRNIPLLLQLLLLYAALLMMLPALPHAWEPVPGVLVSNRGIAIAATLGRFNVVGGWQLSTEMLALVAGLSLYSAAYIAEIVRGGMLSVPTGQREAAISLGLTRFQTLRRVVLPQSLRAILPPLGSWYLNTVKNSSLAVAIAYPDLVSIVDTLISQTGQAIEGVAIIVVAYLTINLAIAGLINTYNARLTRVGAASGVTGAMHASASRNSGTLTLRMRLIQELFPNASQSSLSVVFLIVAAAVCWHVIEWLMISAAFSGGSSACRVAAGACWPFLAENYRLILFGMYPPDQQWRAIAVLVLFSALLALSFVRAFWNKRLALAWISGLLLILILMGGGVFGLTQVPTDKWSGLPLTAVLSSIAVLGALPIAIVLALARRSTALVPRMLASGFIEFVRGTPLIGVLFMAAVMFPLLLPPSFEVNSLMRVQIALVLFTAAYMAESIRAGLQAVPNGQLEAATSLGLTYPQALRHVILPQALRTSLPSLVNTSISEVKNTTLVLIVGMFDLLQTTRLSLVDIEWRPYFVEAYGFTATVFFVICFVISHLSSRIERHLGSASAGRAESKEIA